MVNFLSFCQLVAMYVGDGFAKESGVDMFIYLGLIRNLQSSLPSFGLLVSDI